MGKETKIGLAVIGVLLSVFGLLLFRHLSVSDSIPRWDHEERAAAEPLQPAGSGDEPNVVTAQKDGPAGGIRGSMWDGGATAASEAAVEVPAESYMPAETDAPPDRYAIRPETIPSGAAPATVPIGTSPFQNQMPDDRAAAGGVEPVADDALEPPAQLPPDNPSQPPAGNPLRRLSAELPLESPDEPDNAPLPDEGAELPSQSSDRYAIETDPVGPSNVSDDASQPQGAAPPATGDQPEPQVAAPYYDSREPTPAEPARAAVQDDFSRDAFGDEALPDEALPDDAGRAPSARNELRDPSPDEWPARGAIEPAPVNRAPLPVKDGMYTVQPNDTLWSISEKVYGTGGYFKAIATHNRANLPRSDQLTVGTRVAVPPVEELEQNYPSLCPKQRNSALAKPGALRATATVPVAGGDTYVVEEGDTLFDIARYELGKASRWAEIYELNRELLGGDFDYLRPGIELRLPAATRPGESIGRGGDSRYLR